MFGVAESDMDDVVQDVLLAAYRSFHRYDESRHAERPPPTDPAVRALQLVSLRGGRPRREWSPLSGWLFGIAWRQVSHYRDRAHRRREVPMGLNYESTFAGVDARPRPDDRVAASERAQILSAMLAKLEPQRRVVLVMHDMLDVSIVDIARELQINVNTTQNRLRLAREDFRAAARRLTAERRSALRIGDRPIAADELPPRRLSKPPGRGVVP